MGELVLFLFLVALPVFLLASHGSSLLGGDRRGLRWVGTLLACPPVALLGVLVNSRTAWWESQAGTAFVVAGGISVLASLTVYVAIRNPDDWPGKPEMAGTIAVAILLGMLLFAFFA